MDLSGAIGQILPMAIAVAIVPIPVIAMVLMLGSPRAARTGPAFAIGWLVGLGIVGGVTLIVATGNATADSGQPAMWASILKLVIGLAFLLLAGKTWRNRPKAGEETEMPKWMAKIDTFTPAKALRVGVLLAAANPKNLALVIAAATTIAEAGLSDGQEAVALIVFILVASVTVLTPLVIYFVLGARSATILDGLKTWMAANNATIMIVLLLVIGVVLIGNAIAEL